VLSNDIDVDNPASSLVVTAVRTGAWEGAGAAASPGAGLAGAYGTLVLNANGFRYTLNDNNGAIQALNVGGTLTDNFNYTVQDPGGLTDTAVLTVTISGTNDAAVSPVRARRR
jgi:VCBS repeat-containing protein